MTLFRWRRARALLAPLALTACLGAAHAAQVPQGDPAQPPAAPPPVRVKSSSWSETIFPPIAIGDVEHERDARGEHWRMGTARGVVHQWKPRGYRAATAGTVIYIHGYYTNVDQAVEDHRLLEQFRASNRNALFIMPEAPCWNAEDVYWTDLDALLAEAARLSGQPQPKGPLIIVGHSGAYRTLMHWLAHPRIREIVLLDGLYRGEDELDTWLAAEPPGKRRLLLVGIDTARRTEAWLSRRHPGAIRHRRFPQSALPESAPEHSAPLVYVRSRLEHMKVITEGRAVPELLRWTRLRGL
ncbi:hypothetical protein P2318_21575 [Myxococcaceae bacterium GXIMD 01537]